MKQIIGIDLGTTNCTLAYKGEKIEQLAIPQRIAANREGEKLTLPSFYYLPLEQEGDKAFVGWYAKDRGTELPQRVIRSAKSWLCHDAIDRRASFLPTGDLDGKLSPVATCSAFLSTLKEAWSQKFCADSFEDQTVLVTVPASFDPGAKELVLEAAKMAGYPEITLMEEPLAAFYAWLERHDADWRSHLSVGNRVLVVDIGGGTTDFSLIEVQESEGDLQLKRQSVGNHLLLGGDNIDLTMAYLAQEKLGAKLDSWQFESLIHACRYAKEKLLSDDGPESFDVTIQGRGSSVIGGSLSVTLERDQIEKALVDGFFPFVELQECVVDAQRSGIADVGLPFARDPRITAQLAGFLQQTQGDLPTSVLFNGGTMRSEAFQNRLLATLSKWAGREVYALCDPDFDFAVSRGAAYYGLARAGEGIRVRAGTSHSYYIGIEGAAPAVPGISPPVKAVCIAPFGMEEGSEVTLEAQTFSLLLEQSAFFRFFSRSSASLSTGEEPTVGTIVHDFEKELVELHPIETLLSSQGEGGGVVLVNLKAKVTELGLLQLWCVSEDGRQWKLEFDIRKQRSLVELKEN